MNFTIFLKIVRLLTYKCLTILSRQKSIRSLMFYGSIVLYGGFYVTWMTSRGQYLHYLSGYGYTPLSFDFYCKPNVNARLNAVKGVESANTVSHRPFMIPKETIIDADKVISCYPISSDSNSNKAEKTSPSKLLANILTTGSMFTSNDPDNSNTNAIADLLSSLLMNGSPVLGLADFIRLSDFTNKQMDSDGREKLMSYSIYRERFENFLNIRQKEIRIVSRSNCLGKLFSDHLLSVLGVDNAMNVTLFSSMEAAEINCCENIFAIVDLSTKKDSILDWFPTKYSDCSELTIMSYSNMSNSIVDKPSISIRMRPAAIADTRNFKWTPTRNTIQKYQAGQLLYLLSGFLSLQFEIQNYLHSINFGGVYINSNVFTDESALTNPATYAKRMADAIAESILDSSSTFEAVVNASKTITPTQRKEVSVPVYHRAFPTHPYELKAFWHTFGSIISIILIIFYSIPAAIIGGYYRKEMNGGHLDLLSTYPLLRQYHSAFAWCISGAVWVFLMFLVTLLFFNLILDKSLSVLPSLALLLCGISFGPISIILGLALKRSEEIAVSIPTLVFILMLPGLLYNDLAFDIQRHTWIELLLCLLPSSAGCLIMRQIFSFESTNVEVNWNHIVPVSNTPIYYYYVVLTIDIALYGFITIALVHYFEPIKNKIRGIDATDEDGVIDRSLRSLIGLTDRAIDFLFRFSVCFQQFILRLFTFQQDERISLLSPVQSYGLINRSDHVELVDPSGRSDLPRDEEVLAERRRSISSEWMSGLFTPPRRLSSSRMSTSHFTLSEINDTENASSENALAVDVENVTKGFMTNNVLIEVLSSISTKLYYGTIYTLLGSNGAGKTTFLRILCGLDSEFNGSINVHNRKVYLAFKLKRFLSNMSTQDEMNSRGKVIGWCPQIDPIFDNLSVDEHLQLFGRLLDVTTKKDEQPDSIEPIDNSWSRESYKLELLNELDMKANRYKLGYELSGGMKRRLSLMLAFFGNPSVLLLDEPSSGCDSWNRELIRIAILGRKAYSTILLSTHHVDDMEVLSDDVLFLNERSLIYDGPYVNLFQGVFLEPKHKHDTSSAKNDTNPSQSQLHDFVVPEQNEAIIFTTTDEQVNQEFLMTFRSKTYYVGPGLKYGLNMSSAKLMIEFTKNLESRGLLSWTLSSPSIHSSLENMYQQKTLDQEKGLESSISDIFRRNENDNRREFVSLDHSYFSNTLWICDRLYQWIYRVYISFRAVVMMRWNEIKSRQASFILSQIFVPFIIVLTICLACRDVKYPKILLSDELTDGIGDVMIGFSKKNVEYPVIDAYNLQSVSEELNILNMSPGAQRTNRPLNSNKSPNKSKRNKSNPKPSNQESSYRGYEFLSATFPRNSFHWIDKTTSNHVWKSLYDDYYHHQYYRSSAYVLDDVIPDWIESSVSLHEDDFPVDLHVNMTHIFEDIVAAQLRICNVTSEYPKETSTTSRDSTSKSFDDNSENSAISKSKIFFCGHKKPLVKISLVNISDDYPLFHDFNDSMNIHENSKILVISVSETLYANLTMMSNVTTYHAAPIFFKEIFPLIYASLFVTDSSDNVIQDRLKYVPYYDLYSHPLPEKNLSNEVYIERGYIGSVLILLYIFLCSTKAVRMITNLRSIHVKPLLHMKGLSCYVFWISNGFVDILSIYATYLSIGIGLFVGGDPVSSYFFEFPPWNGHLYLLSTFLFSLAIVSSSYSWNVLSTDELSSQLFMLITTITNGIFLKLFFDRHKYSYWLTLSQSCLIISPSYALSTCFFEMFRWHAVTMAIDSSHVHSDTSQRLITQCMRYLLIQFMSYLLLTVIIDRYSQRIVLMWRRFIHSFIIYYRTFRKLIDSSMNPSTPQDQRNIHDKADTRMNSIHLGNHRGNMLFNHILSKGSIGLFPNISPPYQSTNQSNDDSDTINHDGRIYELVSNLSFITDESSDVEILQDCLGMKDYHQILSINPSISIKDLYIEYTGYHHQSSSFTIKDFNISIHPNERIAVMGSSGSGKSTLFKTIAMAQNLPLGGSIEIMDHNLIDDLWKISDNQLIGYVPQERGLLEHLKVRDIIRLYYDIFISQTSSNHPTNPYHSFQEFLYQITLHSASDDISLNTFRQDSQTNDIQHDSNRDEEGILHSKYLDYPIYALSGGNKKKLLLILAQLGNPSLLLLDEITTGVDPLSAERILRYLTKNIHIHSNSSNLLFSSHRIEECHHLCNRVIILHQGKLYYNNTIQNFQSLAISYYQIDITLTQPNIDDKKGSNGSSKNPIHYDKLSYNQQIHRLYHLKQKRKLNEVIDGIHLKCRQHGRSYERLVIYSPILIRITFERCSIPMSMIWEYLEELKTKRMIERYLFREMNMEEVLSSIIATMKSIQS